MIRILLTFLALSVGYNAAIAQTTAVYERLADRRSQIQFPTTTEAERATVLEQAELIFNQLFVHRSLKIQDFGLVAELNPRFAKLKQNIAGISDFEFQKELADIFYQLRDFHTRYHFPVPYSCYRTLLPVTLENYVDATGARQIGVSAVSSDSDILKLASEVSKITAGDTLLTYNGVGAVDAANKFENESFGPNQAAVTFSTTEMLYYRGQNLFLTPEEDTVDLSLRKSDGTVYSVTLPYISRANLQCLKGAAKTKTRSKTSVFGQAVNEDQTERISIFKSLKADTLLTANFVKTAEPTISYKIITNEDGKFGVLRFDSFSPQKLDISDSVMLVIQLLTKELAATDGLIVDLRDTSGGSVTYAEVMIQFFSPSRVIPVNFRPLNSAVNQWLAKNNFAGFDQSFIDELKKVEGTNSEFPVAVPYDLEADMNTIGQLYKKPVSVFTNAGCYSACEVVTALLKDSGGAKVWTEDGTTGGGGANNMYQTDMVYYTQTFPNSPFQALPHGEQFLLAWRQIVRTGLGQGQLIENIGVTGDFLAPNTYSDFRNDSEQQFKLITAELKARASLTTAP